MVPLKKQKPRKRKQNNNEFYDISSQERKKIDSVAISVDVVDFGSQLKMNHNDFHHTHTHSTSHKMNNNETK